MNIKQIKFNGRYAFLDNHYCFFNGGSGFSFTMKGKSFTVSLKSIPANGYFYIIVDRDYNSKTKYQINNQAIKYVFSKEGVHYVDVIKANEANDNAMSLLDLLIDGKQLDYDFAYSKKARVFGDSTIAGFGILEHNGEGSIHNSDSVRDFCFHALYELNYDADILSASGWGLAFSIYTQPNNMGIYDYFDKVAVYKNIPWIDNEKYDLLIISLGCNDNSYIEAGMISKEKGIDVFVSKYQALIDSQIKLNKDLKILIVYGTLKEENAYYLNEEVYRLLKPKYPNLFIHKFHGDNSAIANHAYVTAHDAMCEELKEVIKAL